MTITLHTQEDFEGMKIAGRLAAEVLDYIAEFVEAGVTTNYLNDLCHKKILSQNAIPAPLNYRGFPKSICTSVNHVICHGIPDDKKLKKGDLIKIDVTVIFDGWHGDSCRSFWVGDVPVQAKRLTEVTYESMMLGIEKARAGNTLGDIGHAIQSHAEKFGYSVVRDYCGHGIGRIFHTEPNILHYGKAGAGLILEEGMFFTVEPMINAGKYETKLSSHDGWTVTTKDRSLSAQFEHTIGITKGDPVIFTKSPKGFDCPPYKV